VVISREKCGVCGADVIVAREAARVGTYDVAHTRMLVILSFPVIEEKKRVALGPCHDKAPFLMADDEAVTYFGHVYHKCAEVKP
jgi:hypothetical protein